MITCVGGLMGLVVLSVVEHWEGVAWRGMVEALEVVLRRETL